MKPSELYKKFLDLEATEPRPAELLGLSEPESVDEPALRAALAARLRQVDGHVHARTPEADQVRMALHAAAAVLSDAMLRTAVNQAARHTHQASNQTEELPAALAAAASLTTALTPLEAAIVRVLAGGGGWTGRSQQQLAYIALQWGLTPGQLLERIGELARRWALSSPTDATSAAAAVRELEPTTRWGTRVALLLALTTGVAAVLFSLTAVFVQDWLGRKGPTFAFPDAPGVESPPPPRADLPAGPPAERSVAEAPSAPAMRTTAELIQDARRIEREIIASAGTISEATQLRLRDWLDEVGERWPRLSPTEIAAVNKVILEAFQAGAEVSPAARETALLLRERAGLKLDAEPWDSQSASVMLRRSYIAGLIASLHVDPRSSRSLRSAIEQVAGDWPVLPADVIPPTTTERAFAGGALASLRTDVSMLVESLELASATADSWNHWRAAITAAHSLLGTSVSGDYLSAVQLLLLRAPEGSDPGGSYEGVLRRLLSLVDFSQSETQGVVVQWLLNPRIRTRDLHTVTSCIVELELAPGRDETYVLVADAAGHERARLTRRWSQSVMVDRTQGLTAEYSAGSTLVIDAALRQEWLWRVQGELDQSIEGIAASTRLRRALRYARFRGAAEQIARGDLDAARKRLNDIRVSADSPPRATSATHVGDGRLTTALAVPGLTEARKIQLINAFGAREAAIGPADARTLATLALAEPSLPLRDAAQQRIRWEYRNSPHMLLALLDLIAGTRVIRSQGLAETIERITGARLPQPQDDSFIPAVRQALTGRLLELRESAATGRLIDELAHELASAYQEARGGTGNAASPEMEALALFERWRALATARGAALPGDADLTAPARRLSAALLLAQGPMQQLAAIQLATLETMAAVTIAESPAGQDDVLRVLESARTRLAGAQSALVQIELLERAMLEVMHLRFAAATPREGAGP